MKQLKVLVACEESQAVTIELRKLGVEAYSCDIQKCSGGHPEWHLQQDVVPLLQQKWDMIIAFPPCTHLAVSGAAWFEQKRKDGRQQQGIDFFMMFANADCPKIAIENPVGIMSSKWRKPDQIIQPWQFGHPESKKTCLWLKGLPKLQPTKILELPKCGYWDNQTKEHQNKLLVDGVWIGWNDPRTAHLRSKTYQGIANAMAEQWVEYILNETNLSEVTHMEKWPEDYECDGQLSLFPVDFSKCMNPPETERQYSERMSKLREQKDEQIQSNA